MLKHRGASFKKGSNGRLLLLTLDPNYVTDCQWECDELQWEKDDAQWEKEEMQQ